MTPLAPHFDFSRLTAARLRRRAGVVLGLGRYRRTLSAMASRTAGVFISTSHRAYAATARCHSLAFHAVEANRGNVSAFKFGEQFLQRGRPSIATWLLAASETPTCVGCGDIEALR